MQYCAINIWHNTKKSTANGVVLFFILSEQINMIKYLLL